jgi:hypothetical protein
MADPNTLTPAQQAQQLADQLKNSRTRLDLEREIKDELDEQYDLLNHTSDATKQIVAKNKEINRWLQDRVDLGKSIMKQIDDEQIKKIKAESISDNLKKAAEFRTKNTAKQQAKMDAASAAFDQQSRVVDQLNEQLVLEGQLTKVKFQRMQVEAASMQRMKKVNTILEKTGLSETSIGKGIVKIAEGAELAELAWAGGLFVVYEIFKRFKDLDAAAGEFRKKTGLMTSQMADIAVSARQLNVEYAKFGVSIDDAYASAADLYSVFQTTALVTKPMMEQVALLAANFGIAGEDSAKILQLFGTLSSKTGIAAKDVELIGVKLAGLAGVAPKQVFEDMAKASEETLIFMGKNPLQLMRVAIEARRAGTTIDSMSKSARGFLNFQDSITDEMEASALTGKSVNFQLSRQLAFQGDIAGSRKAALEVIKQIGDFSEMNVYQQEALAKASGMTVQEIISQQNQTEALNELKKRGSASDLATVKYYEDMNEKLKNGNKQTDQQLADSLTQSRLDQQRQTVIEQIENSLKAAGITLTDALLPIAQQIMPTIVTLADWLGKAAQIAAVAFGFVGDLVSGLLSPLTDVFSSLSDSTDTTESWKDYINDVRDAAKLISPIFSAIGKIIGSVIIYPLKFVANLIGTTIGLFTSLLTGEMGIGDFIIGELNLIPNALEDAVIKPLLDFGKSILHVFGVDLPDGILSGMSDAMAGLFGILTTPFTKALTWLSDMWTGNSPSGLGLSIVHGLESVGGAMFDFLTSPFKMAWDFVKGLPFVGKIFGGIEDIAKAATGQAPSNADAAAASPMIEVKNLDTLTDAISQLTAATLRVLSTAPTATVAVPALANDTSNAGLASKLDELISLMKGGAIAVNLDGRLVSKGLASAPGR